MDQKGDTWQYGKGALFGQNERVAVVDRGHKRI